MLIEMIPVRPRIRMIYETSRLTDDQMPTPNVLKSNQEPSALYHTNVQACTTRKLPIHERIVVVGCSTTALGFLEELLFRYSIFIIWNNCILHFQKNAIPTVKTPKIYILFRSLLFHQPDFLEINLINCVRWQWPLYFRKNINPNICVSFHFTRGWMWFTPMWPK